MPIQFGFDLRARRREKEELNRILAGQGIIAGEEWNTEDMLRKLALRAREQRQIAEEQQRAEINANRQERQDKVRQRIHKGFETLPKLADSPPEVRRMFRQVLAGNMEKAGYTVPPEFINITDTTKLKEEATRIQFEGFNKAVAAWQKEPTNTELESEAMAQFSSLGGLKGFPYDLSPYQAAFADIRKRAAGIRKRKIEPSFEEKEQIKAKYAKPLVTVNLGDISRKTTARITAQQKAYIKGPKLARDALNDAKARYGIEWAGLSKKEKAFSIRQRALDRIRGNYPQATFKVINGKLFIYDNATKTVIRVWTD